MVKRFADMTRVQLGLVTAAIGIGVLVRFAPVLAADFPLHDGGLFASMIDDIRRSGFILPVTTTYNGGEIPFAYPPLGLYVGASLSLAGIPTLDILRFVPAAVAVALIPMWFVAARGMVGAQLAAIAAVVYAVIPRSYEWLIAGGGLTRGLGLLFALLAVHTSLSWFRSPRRRASLFVPGLAVGATILTHFEAASFAVVTVALLAWRERVSFRQLAAFGAVVFLVVAPWAAIIVSRHGLDPFWAAGGSRLTAYPAAVFEVLLLRFTNEAVFPLGAVLGAVGMLVAIRTNRGWLAAWAVAIVISVPAAMGTFVVLPWSVAAAICIEKLSVLRLRPVWRVMILGGGAAVLVVASVLSPRLPGSAMRPLSADVRAAMAWAETSLPPTTRAVVVPTVGWAFDRASEWYPYLSGHRSVATAQGQEFTDRWHAAVDLSDGLLACSRVEVECFLEFVEGPLREVDVVFLPKAAEPHLDCCPALRDRLRRVADVLYDGAGATVYRLASGVGQE
jgi:4-amino-4-deoxy-L-arabinose transferase-like glycosyltransferase